MSIEKAEQDKPAIDTTPQPKQEQGEPVFHLRQYGDVTKEQLDCYIATGRIDTRPQPKQEQNFCSRCGKRTSDLNDIHTCTPPKQEQGEPVSGFFSREAMKEHSDFHPKPKQEQDAPVALVTGVYGGRFTYAPIKASVILPVGTALYTHPQPKAKQEPTSGFFSREAMKEHSDFHPQTKAGKDEPVFHLRQYGDVTKEQLDCYIATGRIDTCPQHRKPLTDEQIDDLARTMVKGNKSVNWLARAIEAAHGINYQERKAD